MQGVTLCYTIAQRIPLLSIKTEQFIFIARGDVVVVAAGRETEITHLYRFSHVHTYPVAVGPVYLEVGEQVAVVSSLYCVLIGFGVSYTATVQPGSRIVIE